MTQQPEKLEQTLEIIRDQHKDLLLQLEEPEEVDLEQVRIFLKTLAQAGAIIHDAEDRVLLHELIRYWSSFISDKTGEFPVVQLQPFDGPKVHNRTGKNALDAADREQMKAGTALPSRSESMEDPTMVHPWLLQLNASLAQQITEQRNAAQDLHTMLNTTLAQVVAEQKKQGEELQNTLVVKSGEINTLLVTSLSQLIAGQKQVVDKLTDTADTLEMTAITLDRAVMGIETSTREQARLLAAMNTLQTSQKVMTDQIGLAVGEIKPVLKEVRETGLELRSVSVDIDQFVRALRDLPNVLKAGMLDPLKYYADAAVALSQGSHALQRVAYELEKRLTSTKE